MDINSVLRALVDALIPPEQPNAPREQVDPGQNTRRLGVWDPHELKRALVVGSESGYFPGSAPDHIDFSQLYPFVEKLGQQTRDGIERGRICFYDRTHRQLVMGKVSVGTEKMCRLDGSLPPGRFPIELVEVLMIHTHPRQQFDFDKLRSIHLSGQDFKALLLSHRIQLSAVICEDVTLLALKTKNTPRNPSDSSVDQQINRLEAELLGRGATSATLRVFNKMVALHYGLELYLIKPGYAGIAKRIKLVPG